MTTAPAPHTWAGNFPAPIKLAPPGKPYSPNPNIARVIGNAMGQVGFVEGVNNDNPYGAHFGINHQPYCALGVSWAFNQASLGSLIKGQYDWGFAECEGAYQIFLKEGLILPPGVKAKAGDIALWAWDNPTHAEHTELIVADEDIHGLTLVGWNTSPDHATGSQANGGGCYLRHRSRYGLRGIVRPKYPQ